MQIHHANLTGPRAIRCQTQIRSGGKAGCRIEAQFLFTRIAGQLGSAGDAPESDMPQAG